MTRRERVVIALKRQVPDRVPVDIGGSLATTLLTHAYRRLAAHLGFGKDLAFWGAIDTHRVLPLGSPADVREEVRHRIADLGPGGGYVLAAVHNIQADAPPENVVAMVEAAREFGVH